MVFHPAYTGWATRKLTSSFRGPYVVTQMIAPSLAVIRLVINPQAKELTVSTDRLRIYNGGETIFQPEDTEQYTVEDDGDKFGEVLILPPAFHPVPPVKRNIEEGEPLPASTEAPTENDETLKRDERDERRRVAEQCRLHPPAKFQVPPRGERVLNRLPYKEEREPMQEATEGDKQRLPEGDEQRLPDKRHRDGESSRHPTLPTPSRSKF